MVKEHCVDTGIAPELIYGMDESGFPLGEFGKKRVVGRRGVKRQHKQGSGDKENVTVLVTICADGTHLRPTIIYKTRTSWQSGEKTMCPEHRECFPRISNQVGTDTR